MRILQSIKPQYCELIASGMKTIEVRKTRPKCELPVKVYIYCTKDKLLTKSHNNGNIYRSENKYKSALEKAGNITLSGKVIGEYVCDEITGGYLIEPFGDFIQKQTCLTYEELNKYGNGKPLYLWHISDLVIYDKPKELSEFYKGNMLSYDDWLYGIYNGKGGAKSSYKSYQQFFIVKHPPQSWCYI